MLAQIKPLTQEERQTARAAAQEAVQRDIGDRPNREYFNHHATRRYPPGVTKLINVLCIVLLLAAFTPSAIRLYVIGSETFGAAVSFELAAVAVGIATVLTAEIGQVVFSLALATLGTTPNARRLLYASMGIATTIALVGNVQVALSGHAAWRSTYEHLCRTVRCERREAARGCPAQRDRPSAQQNGRDTLLTCLRSKPG